jgi:hypothetical protein
MNSRVIKAIEKIFNTLWSIHFPKLFNPIGIGLWPLRQECFLCSFYSQSSGICWCSGECFIRKIHTITTLLEVEYIG